MYNIRHFTEPKHILYTYRPKQINKYRLSGHHNGNRKLQGKGQNKNEQYFIPPFKKDKELYLLVDVI